MINSQPVRVRSPHVAGRAASGVARSRGLPFFYAVPLPGLPTREFAYPTVDAHR